MKEKWKARIIRMSDELWFECMKQAKLLGISTSEYIRNILKNER
jgi:hypothetical protein